MKGGVMSPFSIFGMRNKLSSSLMLPWAPCYGREPIIFKGQSTLHHSMFREPGMKGKDNLTFFHINPHPDFLISASQKFIFFFFITITIVCKQSK